MDDFLSANKAAKLLGVSQTTVTRWIELGRFPNVRVYEGDQRDTIRIPKSDVDELINKEKRAS